MYRLTMQLSSLFYSSVTVMGYFLSCAFIYYDRKSPLLLMIFHINAELEIL